MRRGIRRIGIPGITVLFLFACSRLEVPEQEGDGLVPVEITVGKVAVSEALPDSRAAASPVSRILVLPFQKLNTALPDSQADNFIPAWNFARQWDVNAFPAESLSLKLAKSFTYKVLVIGYRQSDYNYYSPGAVSNLVELAVQPAPSSLANFRFMPKSPARVPEFFTCVLTASQNGIPIGTVFTPGETTNISLSGQLKRFVSGLNVSVTNIPGYVKSMTLTAEKMVKSIQVNDTVAVAVQVPGDQDSRVIQKLIPVSGSVNFTTILLPTLNVNKSKYYLIVEYDSTTETYTINVPDSEVSQSNSIILLPNGTVNITGSYSLINIGFEISRTIDLDDDSWDGVN